ncbi:hypothetical protein [Prosthecobacter sp.]|uniref:hypothetical protein n=1 Tax=Prosthecobacter sp. TaxID=1965333 RepID=UPI003784DCB3
MPLKRLILLFALWTTSALACTIPVFRFALDRWEADKFHLVLPQAVAKDSAIQDLLRPLRANGKANLDITTSKDAAQQDTTLGYSRDSEKQVWSGRLDAAALAAVLDSPARQKLVQQLLAGDSVIWVIADSGSPVDVLEVERIEKRLKFLEQVAALPIQDPNDPDSQLGPGPPLRLKFSTLRLRRNDPAESLLLRMLAGPKADFDPAITSFAGAVFGRGRVLGAWPLGVLDDASLETACMFLVGRCGCRLKNESPGWDILLNLDWEKALPAATPASELKPASADANADADAPAPSAAPQAPPLQAQVLPKPITLPEVDVVSIVPDAAPPADEGRKGPLVAGLAAGLVLLVLLPRWLRK